MYVVVQHEITNPETAFARGEKLMKSKGAPQGARVLQFYPAADGSAVTCLWETSSMDGFQEYVDKALGDSSKNTCYVVNAEEAFAHQALGIREKAELEA